MRNIPAALLAHLQGDVTSTCRLLAITLVDGRQFGITTLDRDVDYLGLTYYALNGFDSSVIATDAGLSVDNSEATALLAADVPGINEQMVLAGELDDAQWRLMLVNWADLSMGHVILDAGDIGEVRTVDGMVYIPELLSFTMRLKQAIGDVWSRRCRATFGSDAEGQHGCGVDASGMWLAGTVTGVDASDPYRVFADTSLAPTGSLFPGRVVWTSGPNAGSRIYVVEAYSSVSDTVALMEPTSYPIAIGHTFNIRADCNKSPSNCIAYANFINYKGEPFIPVGDGLESMTPSAQVFGGMSGSTISD